MRLVVLAFMALAALLGGVSLALLAVFLYLGSFELVPLGLSAGPSLAFDTLLCGIFFAQHSLMIRRPFRRRLIGALPDRFHPALYSIASGATLLVLLLLWQRSEALVFFVGGPVRWILRAVFAAAVLGFALTARSLRAFDPFGLRPLYAHLRGHGQPAMPLTIEGMYRWVRHPLYTLSLVLFWASPDLTLDRTLFATLWTAWVVIGARLEEHDLVEDFGDAYRAYQRSTPMLIPWRLPHARPAPAGIDDDSVG